MDLFNTKKVKALQVQLSTISTQLAQNNILGLNKLISQQNVAVYPDYNLQQQSNRYCNTDDIYSIIRLVATTSALIPMYAYEIKDEKSLKRINYKNFTPSGIAQTKLLQTKALEDLPETDKLYQLLENPHLHLSKFEFFEAIYTLLNLQSECILYKLRPELGVNAGLPIKMEFLESHNVVRHVGGFPHQIVSYDYYEDGRLIIKGIPPEDIIHIRHFKGISPLQALRKRLARLDSEMDTSVAQLQNGGVPGIIYNKDGQGIETSTAGQHKENFYRYLQDKSNKGAPYWAGDEDLGYIQLGLKLADMDVKELERIDFKKLCNAFGVSDVLFNNDAASTESNIQVQESRLYTNTCLPAVYRVRDALIKGLIPEYNDKKKRHIEADISEIAALQEDMKEMADIYAALPIMRPNTILRAFKLEEDPDPLMNKFYVKTGYVGLDDLQGSGDLPLTEDYTDE